MNQSDCFGSVVIVDSVHLYGSKGESNSLVIINYVGQEVLKTKVLQPPRVVTCECRNEDSCTIQQQL